MAQDNGEAAPPWIVDSMALVAEFFGVGYDTIRTWGRNGMPGDRGSYDLAEIYRWRKDRDEENEEATRQRESPRRNLEMKKLEIEVASKELALRKEAKSLIDRQAASAKISQVSNAIRGRLDALPQELASSLPAQFRVEFIADAKHKVRLVCQQLSAFGPYLGGNGYHQPMLPIGQPAPPAAVQATTPKPPKKKSSKRKKKTAKKKTRVTKKKKAKTAKKKKRTASTRKKKKPK